MINFDLSKQYASGYWAKLNNEAFDENQSEAWKLGWNDADLALQLAANDVTNMR